MLRVCWVFMINSPPATPTLIPLIRQWAVRSPPEHCHFLLWKGCIIWWLVINLMAGCKGKKFLIHSVTMTTAKPPFALNWVVFCFFSFLFKAKPVRHKCAPSPPPAPFHTPYFMHALTACLCCLSKSCQDIVFSFPFMEWKWLYEGSDAAVDRLIRAGSRDGVYRSVMINETPFAASVISFHKTSDSIVMDCLRFYCFPVAWASKLWWLKSIFGFRWSFFWTNIIKPIGSILKSDWLSQVLKQFLNICRDLTTSQ